MIAFQPPPASALPPFPLPLEATPPAPALSRPAPPAEIDPPSLIPHRGVDVTGTVCFSGSGGWVRVDLRPGLALRYNRFCRDYPGGLITVAVDRDGRTWLFDRSMDLSAPWVRDTTVEMLRANISD